MGYSLALFNTAPGIIQSAAAHTIQWKKFHDKGHALPPTADELAEMLLSYLAYSGGELRDFDWLRANELVQLEDYELFLEAQDNFTELSVMASGW